MPKIDHCYEGHKLTFDITMMTRIYDR